MREQLCSKTGIVWLPHVKLASMSAPGPTGERQEHLDAIISFAGAGQRRLLFRGLDILTFKWAVGDLPEDGRFLLNTLFMFLKKENDPTTKFFGDEWIRSLTEAQEINADISEDNATYDQQAIDQKKVRPIQMVKFLRKYVSRRLLALSEGEIAPLMTAMRQLGVGSQGGAEALAIHQLIYDDWVAGSLNAPLAGIKTDVEWNAVRKAAAHLECTLLQQSGDTKPCLMSSKKGFYQCPKTAAQNKEMSTAPQSAAWLLGSRCNTDACRRSAGCG